MSKDGRKKANIMLNERGHGTGKMSSGRGFSDGTNRIHRLALSTRPSVSTSVCFCFMIQQYRCSSDEAGHICSILNGSAAHSRNYKIAATCMDNAAWFFSLSTAYGSSAHTYKSPSVGKLCKRRHFLAAPARLASEVSHIGRYAVPSNVISLETYNNVFMSLMTSSLSSSLTKRRD